MAGKQPAGSALRKGAVDQQRRACFALKQIDIVNFY